VGIEIKWDIPTRCNIILFAERHLGRGGAPLSNINVMVKCLERCSFFEWQRSSLQARMEAGQQGRARGTGILAVATGFELGPAFAPSLVHVAAGEAVP
jgi:hypothetical protein